MKRVNVLYLIPILPLRAGEGAVREGARQGGKEGRKERK